MEPPSKRQRLSKDSSDLPEALGDAFTIPRTLGHPISPPLRKRPRPTGPSTEQSKEPEIELPRLLAPANKVSKEQIAGNTSSSATSQNEPSSHVFSSPFHLTWVQDLPNAANTDAVTLKDLLGDPLIAECWEFNYLHDIDFLMAAFDQDTKDLVQVHLVHGFWKKEDESRLMLQEQAKAYKNVTLHCAYMPEMFGTHHSKMMILIRHDDTAQVIIHTANMIARDWANMTQALWKSPLLPLIKTETKVDRNQRHAVGSGQKFKVNLLNYLKEYNQKRPVCNSLVQNLAKYDFSAIQAALVASVPGRHNIYDETEETKWGWAALKQALQNVPVQEGKSQIVVQISSIATLGPTDTWLRRTLFESFKASKNKPGRREPTFKIVFPTPDEIRRSLNGYVSGASIHTKVQSAQQAKQLLYLKPFFCHWANDAPNGQQLGQDAPVQEAGRKRAAPHIKTYIRYGADASIDWALTTSANLSKQAWGEAVNGAGEVRIASWEIGVLVWPSLFAEKARMVGTFQKDAPDSEEGVVESTPTEAGTRNPVVGIRIPYDLPLQAYGADEMPWVATASYPEPDWKGQMWTGY